MCACSGGGAEEKGSVGDGLAGAVCGRCVCVCVHDAGGGGAGEGCLIAGSRLFEGMVGCIGAVGCWVWGTCLRVWGR